MSLNFSEIIRRKAMNPYFKKKAALLTFIYRILKIGG